MAKIIDEGIIIYLNKYNDRCYKIVIFSKNNGVIQTFLKKDRKNKYLTYDLVSFECDNIGQFSYRNLELKHVESYWNNIYSSKLFLTIANSIAFIVTTLLLERGNCSDIYDIFAKNIREFNKDKNKNDVLMNYMSFLKYMVIFFGFGLNTSSCFVSGNSSVYYISPKTGNCVSKEVGRNYKDKLFVIPKCFYGNYIGVEDYKNGIYILLYFLRRIFADNGNEDKVKYLEKLYSNIT